MQKEKLYMKQLIAYCGLDCESCQARLATLTDDQSLRKKVAEEWSQLNQADITPDMINCTGCRADGVKTPFCESLCPIRKCAQGRNLETCGACGEKNTCEKLAMIASGNESARENLGL